MPAVTGAKEAARPAAATENLAACLRSGIDQEKTMRVLSLAVVLGALGTLGCAQGDDQDSASSAQAAPRSLLQKEQQRAESPLQGTEYRHDFGAIPIGGGDVETVFEISNESSSPVRLVALYTSCGCTTAVVEFADGSEAGPFGMPGHAGMQTQLDRTIGPGETLNVRVTFDPAAHGPDGLGSVMRAVTLHTDDGASTELVITADVVRV